jgi:hypothetical protein
MISNLYNGTIEIPLHLSVVFLFHIDIKYHNRIYAIMARHVPFILFELSVESSNQYPERTWRAVLFCPAIISSNMFTISFYDVCCFYIDIFCNRPMLPWQTLCSAFGENSFIDVLSTLANTGTRLIAVA